MCDFRKACVGDKVWSMIDGWGYVYAILGSPAINPIAFQWGSDNRRYFTYEGKLYPGDKNPVLFWDEVKIVPPPRPKRKVKKVIEGWINIYGVDNYSVGLFDTRDKAIRARQDCDVPRYKGDPIFIRHEYEEFE